MLNDVYSELETSKGEKKLYQINKAWRKIAEDFRHIKQIKDEKEKVVTDKSKIKEM